MVEFIELAHGHSEAELQTALVGKLRRFLIDYPHREEFPQAARTIGQFRLPQQSRFCPKDDRRARRLAANKAGKP